MILTWAQVLNSLRDEQEDVREATALPRHRAPVGLDLCHLPLQAVVSSLILVLVLLSLYAITRHFRPR